MKNVIIVCVEAILVFAFLGLAVFLFISSSGDVKEYASAKKEYSDIASSYVNVIGDSDENVRASYEEVHPKTNLSEYVPANGNVLETFFVDFPSLNNVNPDTVGWIYIPNTICSYPVVKATTNTEYLKKTFEGKKNSAGCIFMDSENSGDFTDINTILYGHNMKDGSMFRSLRKYTDKSFYEQNPYIYIFTPTKGVKYDIISVFTDYPKEDYYVMDFDTDEDYLSYLSYISSISIYPCVNPDAYKNLLTLSTCTGNTGEKRFILVLQENTSVLY